MREFPGFWAAMAGCVLVGIVFGWQSHRLRLQASRLQQRLASERCEWRDAEAQALLAAPKARDRADALERERQARQGLLAALARGEKALLDGSSIPRGRTEACAALTAMALELRELANERGIAISPEEDFGFGEYAQSGPASPHLAMVHRQSRIVAATVRLLIAARPIAIEGVLRGPTGLPGDRAASTPGWAAHATVRLEFSGHTGVLRDFLNGLARSELPFRVRDVAVESDELSATAAAGVGALLITPEPRRFAVGLACFQLDPGMFAQTPVDGSAAVARPEPAVWTEQSSAMAEARHCDLFTAPTVKYDAVSGTFALRRFGETEAPPTAEVLGPDGGPALPLQRYRVRLLGHFRAGTELWGTFADVAAGRTFLARAGQTVTKSGVRVRTLQRVRRVQESGTVHRAHGWLTVAEIEDLLSGETATLTDGARKEIEAKR